MDIVDGHGVTARQYINGLSLDFSKWINNGDGDVEYTHAILLCRTQKAFGSQFYLSFGKGYDNNWMTADDLGWSGPEKYVLMYLPVKI